MMATTRAQRVPLPLPLPLAVPLPDALCLAQVCGLLALPERIFGLARVSRRWRRLALTSIHCEPAVDLTWCTGEHELERVVQIIVRHVPVSDLGASRLEAVKLYGPRVSAAVLERLFQGVGAASIKRVGLESKQSDDATLLQLTHCAALTHLALNCIKLSDGVLSSLSRACAQLQTLNLSGCSRIHDDGVIAVATNCTRLRDLNLFMCHRISDRAMVALALQPSKTLERVVVDRCLKISGLALRFLMKLQPNLCELSFANCPKVVDQDFLALDKQVPPSSRLELIDMSGCASIGDTGATALITRNASALRFLSARALLTLSSASFLAVSRCIHLHSLNLSMCRTLQNSDLREIVAACTQLQALMLQGCVHIDDVGVTAVATHGRELRSLSLEFCYNVTDCGFRQVVAKCRRLVDLNVKALNQLTADAFLNLIEFKPGDASLQRINIGACADFETTVLYAAIIKRRYPRAKIEWT